jgi:hypothetical protein
LGDLKKEKNLILRHESMKNSGIFLKIFRFAQQDDLNPQSLRDSSFTKEQKIHK